MQQYKNLSSICLVGIITFLFIESFYNVLVNINAHIFMNFTDIPTIMPSLVITIIILIVEYFFFMSARIEKKFKPYILIYVITGIRIGSQFVLIPSVILILNLLMVFTILIFFMMILLIMEKSESYVTFSQLVGSIIIGLGIQFTFLMINISSSLTSDVNKIIPIFAFMVIIVLINNYLFYPDNFEKFLSNTGENSNNSEKKSVSLVHFVILGTLFIYSMMWIFNPMALSAYDIINQSINGIFSNSMNVWPSYGFTYYIFLILLTAMLSYGIIVKYLFSLNQKLLKSIVAIILYISYLFNFYTFNSPKKLLMGVVIFFLTIIFFIILHVRILWPEFMSLLKHITIQIITGFVLILIYEGKNLKISLTLKERPMHLKKEIIVLFASILIINGISIGVVVQTRSIEPVQNPNPTFMIWNTHNAIGDDDVFHVDRLIAEIKEVDPDILALNEIDLGAIKTSSMDLPSYFAHKLNMYYFYGFTFYKHYGNVILSKYPILEAEIIPLPLTVQSAEPRSLIRAKFQINSLTWTVFVTHLSTESEDRLVQVPFIVNEIEKELTFERIVWMGDLNFEPTSTEYTLINSTSALNFTDTYRFLNSDPGYTGHFDDNHIPRKRIDYILCSPDLTPIISEVYYSLSSDHCAVITDF